MTWRGLVLGAVLLSAAPSGGAGEDAAASKPVLVVLAEGAVERTGEGGAATLLEIGHDLGYGDRVSLGQGAVAAVVDTEGEGAGRVLRLRGPFEGTVKELLAAARGAPALARGEVDSLRLPQPAVLDGPGITRGASKGPLRPVYPSGGVVGPCGPFVFVSGLKDLSGGTIEIRVFDKDPSAGGTPVAKVRSPASPVDVLPSLPRLVEKKPYWWQAVALLPDGTEALAGEAATFTVVPSPLSKGFPPGGFDGPEARVAWHLSRAKALTGKKHYIDALRELGILVAAGGGSSAVDRQRDQILEKLGLDAEDREALEAVTSVRDPAKDTLRMVDGRELPGRLVKEEADGVLFQSEGTTYQILKGDIAEIRRASTADVVSAAPFVTMTSKRYVLTTNAGREFGEEALRRLEAFFDAFAKNLGDELGARNARNLKVRIFRDENDYHAYLKKDHPEEVERARGFYAYKDSTLYLYRSSMGKEETTWGTLYHEGTHQVLHIVCNQDADVTRLPGYWLVEAVPMYMESLRWDGKALLPGGPVKERAAHFRSLRDKGELLPLGRFTELAQDGFLSADRYDQAHALYWYLLDAEKGKHRAALMRYTKSLFQNKNRNDADRKAFGRPIPEVAKDYEEWFLERAAGTE